MGRYRNNVREMDERGAPMAYGNSLVFPSNSISHAPIKTAINYVVLTRVQDCEESYQEAIYYHTQDIPIPTLNVTLIDQTYQHHTFFLPRFYQTKLHVCLHYEKRVQLYWLFGDDLFSSGVG